MASIIDTKPVIVLSIDITIRILIFALYLPACLLVFWRLYPQLSLSAKLLGSSLLAAQILVISLSLAVKPASDFERWFWDLNQENNVPATLASTQMALVSAVAFLTAVLPSALRRLLRLYFAGIGLVLLFFAWDEFFLVHERIEYWQIFYSFIGAALVAATLLVAARAEKPLRKWLLCFIIGLAVGAAGAIVLESLRIPATCGALGFLTEAGRCQLHIIEECLEFLGIWLTLIAVLGLLSNAEPKPSALAMSFLFIFPILWILALSPRTLIAFLDFRLFHQSTSIRYEPGVELQALRIDQNERSIALRLFASTGDWHDYSDLGYALHLVDRVSGESLASANATASRQNRWRIAGRSYFFWIFKQGIELQLSPQIPSNRALLLVLSLWRQEGDAYTTQKIISSDLPLLKDTQVILNELVLPEDPPPSSHNPVAIFEDDLFLDAADLPASAQAGETLGFSFTWRAEKAARDDIIQFLHFGHEESGLWWVHDQQPLGARLPTGLWYKGLADTESWQVPLPADLAPGRYAVYTGLYHANNQARLPASDRAGATFVDARVPLGFLIVEGA